jgi:hypothetical protein
VSWLRMSIAALAAVGAVSTMTVEASAANRHLSVGTSGSRSTAPTWSAQWLQANPGQPLVLILNPRAAKICFVGLRGPQGAHPVGWRFDPAGHRLSLTLLTHTDATAGTWVLSASCQRTGVKSRTAKVTISVPSPGGPGVLAAHGDMRVEPLSGPTS